MTSLDITRLLGRTPQGRRDVCVLAMLRGPERYLYVWEVGDESALANVIGRQAHNPELSLTPKDAAELCTKMRKLADAKCEGE